jgi:hypothetical protein
MKVSSVNDIPSVLSASCDTHVSSTHTVGQHRTDPLPTKPALHCIEVKRCFERALKHRHNIVQCTGNDSTTVLTPRWKPSTNAACPQLHPHARLRNRVGQKPHLHPHLHMSLSLQKSAITQTRRTDPRHTAYYSTSATNKALKTPLMPSQRLVSRAEKCERMKPCFYQTDRSPGQILVQPGYDTRLTEPKVPALLLCFLPREHP